MGCRELDAKTVVSKNAKYHFSNVVDFGLPFVGSRINVVGQIL
jgi:hypothetical protein